MSPTPTGPLGDQLTDDDHRLIENVERYRLLSSRQIQRLHFDHARPTSMAAARACNRALTRLRNLDILRALTRRVGGARAGSAGHIWYLGPTGERLLRSLRRPEHHRRHNYREPSHHFVNHTLTIAELAVQAIEAGRHGHFDILQLETEPASWQRSLHPHGVAHTLKPDLRLITATTDYEDHWFIEADLATEHLPVILRQCAAYTTFHATGRYQASHGLFPAVLWVTPTQARANAILSRVAATTGLNADLFRACASPDFLSVLADRPPP